MTLMERFCDVAQNGKQVKNEHLPKTLSVSSDRG
jgi:hypothetical protein